MSHVRADFGHLGGGVVTYTYNSVADAKDHLWGPFRFFFTTTIVCSDGRQVVVVIDFFTFKNGLRSVVFTCFSGPIHVANSKL